MTTAIIYENPIIANKKEACILELDYKHQNEDILIKDLGFIAEEYIKTIRGSEWFDVNERKISTSNILSIMNIIPENILQKFNIKKATALTTSNIVTIQIQNKILIEDAVVKGFFVRYKDTQKFNNTLFLNLLNEKSKCEEYVFRTLTYKGKTVGFGLVSCNLVYPLYDESFMEAFLNKIAYIANTIEKEVYVGTYKGVKFKILED